MLIQFNIVENFLDSRNGELAPCLLLYYIGHLLCHIYSKLSLYGRRTSRPIEAQAGGLFPRLAQETVVNGYGPRAGAPFQRYAHVEGVLVKFLLEVMPEEALAGLGMPCKRQEIDLSVDCKNQNHGLHDETFKTFSYLCIWIECRVDNRTYFVKGLNHYSISVIYYYKDTKFGHLTKFLCHIFC